jgi:putative hydrolase of the HAD superfamily
MIIPEKVNAVLFDFGDTLIHGNFTSGATDWVWEEIYREVINPAASGEIAALPEIRAAWREHVQSAMARTWTEKTEQEIDYVTVVQKAFAHAKLPLAADLDFLRRVVEMEHSLLYEKIVTVAPDALTTLARLRENGYRLGLVSNFCNLPEVAYGRIRQVGLLEFFDASVLSCEVGWRKPSLRIYEAICEKLNVAPENCLFVGDRLIEDVRGPQQIGMQTVLTTQFRTEEIPGITPDAVIARLDELLDLLELGARG